MGLFKKKKKPRVCVIGLDGVPYSMIKDLAQKGVMPFTGKLIQSGHLHKMKASLPEISSVSWTNFMTGKNPGIHGIFGFTDLKEKSYEMRFPNFLDVKTDTIWDKLGEMKKMSVVINQPSTYPARKINGILISGFVAIEMDKAVSPVALKDPLEKLGYQIDIDTLKAREDHEFLWKELDRTLVGRQKAFESLWETDWDLFEVVITGTDRIQHFLWSAYEEKNHAYHNKFLDYYTQIDKFIEKVVDTFTTQTDGDDGLYLLSDHGFAGIEQEVYLNVWLEQEGYLFFETSAPKDLSEIGRTSRAFSMDPNRIYLHLKDKFPRGIVELSEKQHLKNELISKLKNLEYSGHKVIRDVFDTEEIYEGPYVAHGPDLIVLSEYGFDMKGSVKKKEIFGRSNLQGMHTWDDAFFWANREKGQDLAISDLASIIMENFE